jgi:hypothetical protein
MAALPGTNHVTLGKVAVCELGFQVHSLSLSPSSRLLNVEGRCGPGDTTVLLKDLKSLVGAGGVVRDGDVEVQGEHIARIEAMLVKKGCLKGVQAAVKAAAAPKVAEKAPGRSIARLDAKAIELKSKQR